MHALHKYPIYSMYSKFIMLPANPPELSITIPEKRNLSSAFKQWGDFELPIDVLLLTVKDCEFLACYYFRKKPLRSYLKELTACSFLYVGEVGEIDGMTLLKIATQPRGVENALEILQLKAVFRVGHVRLSEV